ncbi:MAG: TonB-dependent receptor domain-containing protein [Bacteroidales bacterium]
MSMYTARRIRWILASVFIVAALSVYAQQKTGSISGKVFSGENRNPLVHAEVVLESAGMGATSSQQGAFIIEQVPAGDYSLMVKHMGYQTAKRKVQVREGADTCIEIILQPDVKVIPGVEILGEGMDYGPYVKEVIPKQKIQSLPARDVGEFLRSEPNVSGIRKGGGNIDPVIRGFKFSQLNVQNNTGQKIEGGCPNRMDPATSHIDIHDITRIEILKGPYALRYGPSFGAVLNLVTEKARPFESFQINATAARGWESNWNGNKEHLTVLGGGQRVYFALSGNRQSYGNYQAGNGQEIKSSFEKYNYTAELGFRPWDHHEMLLTYKRSQGFDVRFPALPMDEREDRTTLMSATYKYLNPGNTLRSIEAKIYNSHVHHEMDNKWRSFLDTVVAVSIIDALNRGGRADVGFASEKSNLHTGFDYEYISKDGERLKNLILQPGLPVKTEDVWNDAFIRNLGLFAEYRFDQTDKTEWILSGRVDFNSAGSAPMALYSMSGSEMYYDDRVDSDFTNVSLSAGASHHFSETLTLNFALGRGVRNPDMVERFIILLPLGYDNYDYLGNPQLKPEKNHQADLSLTVNEKHLGKIRLNGFFSYVTDFITGIKLPPSQVMPQSKDVLGVKQFQNIDQAYLYGFELGWHSPMQHPLGGTLTASYTTGVNPETVKYIVENGQVVDSETVENDPLPEIPPLEANLSIHFRMFNNTLVPEARLRAVASQKRISEAYDEPATPGFITTGISIKYLFNDMLTLAGGVSNLFDKTYYEHLNRRIIGSRAPLYEPGRIFHLNVILNI